MDVSDNAVNDAPELDRELRGRVRRDMVLYGLARLGLFLLLTVIIQGLAVLIGAPVPLVISSLLALLVAFPLSMFVFRSLRLRVTRNLAVWNAQRQAHKEWVKSQLAAR